MDTSSYNEVVDMSRRFAREWKLKLCRQIVGGELSRTKACRDHGLSAAMLERWAGRAETGAALDVDREMMTLTMRIAS